MRAFERSEKGMNFKMKKIKKILGIFVIIILILGIFVIVNKGFNYGMEYKEVTELKFMLGQVLDMNEVQSIVNEAFNNKEVKIQKINYFNDTVNISVVEPTDEEIQTLIDKFNERYEQNNDMENLSIAKTENVTFYEIVKPYILPSVIALISVAVYMAVRFKKEGIIKMLLLPVGVTLLVELLYFAVVAIIQIPVSIWTMPIALILLVLVLVTLVSRLEKNM